MSCPFYNQEKESLGSGIYCNKIDGRPGVRYWSQYCKSNHENCPFLNPAPQPKPEPKQKKMQEEEVVYRAKTEQKRTSGNTRGGGISVLSVIAIGLMVVWGVLFVMGIKMGWIRSDVVVHLVIPEETTVNTQDIVIRSVSNNNKFEDVVATFDENNNCTVKIAPGINTIYVEYEGYVLDLGQLKGNGIEGYEYSLQYTNLLDRRCQLLMIKLEDIYGEKIETTAIQVKKLDETEDLKATSMGEDGFGILVNKGEQELVVQVEGYEPLTVKCNITEPVQALLLTLKEKSE